MYIKYKISIVFIVLALFSCTFSLNGQFLRDSTSINLIKKGIDYIYNYQFGNAEKVSEELMKLYPGHPANFLFKGMITYWKDYPLTITSADRPSFVEGMTKCIDLCDKNKNKENEAEILLVNLCARGLLLLHYADNNLSLEVFPLASSTYQCIKRSFDFTQTYSDFYFFTGVYNYYREAYPEAHPVYRTLAFLFPKGSKVKGLKDLNIVVNKSIILRAEAYSFLTLIYLSFENDFQQATFYSKNLHAVYPDNPVYFGEYIKNLLLMKQYDEAEKEIRSSIGYLKNQFFQAQLTVYQGILQEKKYHNNAEAQKFYLKGIKDVAVFRNFGDEYEAYAYFGLSRISGINGEMDNQKMYRKLAMKLAVFKNIDFN